MCSVSCRPMKGIVAPSAASSTSEHCAGERGQPGIAVRAAAEHPASPAAGVWAVDLGGRVHVRRSPALDETDESGQRAWADAGTIPACACWSSRTSRSSPSRAA